MTDKGTARAVAHCLGQIEMLIREDLGDGWLASHPEVAEAAKTIAAAVWKET
jgi:hypothetical protein